MNSTNSSAPPKAPEAPADSLRDSTASTTGTNGQKSRVNSNSGIYDVSRMTNIKSPVDPFGHNVSHYTKQKAADIAKRAQINSELVRGLLIAMAIPLSAGAAYLLLSGQDIRIEGLSSNPVANTPVAQNPGTETPAVKATLPAPIGAEIVPTSNLHGTLPVLADASNPVDRGIARATSQGPRELKLELDSDGKLKSPYIVELDEEGREVSRKEFEEYAMFLPLLPLGPFEGVKTLSTANVPADFVPKVQTRPFVYTEEESRRLAPLRATAPEIRRAMDNATSTSSSRMTSAPGAAESLQGGAIENAVLELHWMKAASIARDLLGDRSTERRLTDTILLWARTYKPTGDALTEIPLLDLVYAYNNVRHLYRTPDQTLIDDFLKRVVDLQFTRQKSNKLYNESHAVHLLTAAAVGYVIDNPAYQLHALTQYKFHIEKSSELKQSAPGDDEVKSLRALLEAAYIFDRAGVPDYRSARLHAATVAMANSGKTDPPTLLVSAVASAAYFDTALYRRLGELSVQAGLTGTRFGTDEGALKAAVRKPTSSLVASPQALRLPTNAPTKLPPKRK